MAGKEQLLVASALVLARAVSKQVGGSRAGRSWDRCCGLIRSVL
ncbi:MAG TPA: hypothetical protein VGF67_26230 [Ktedonobacteraceae bacterium]